jgi:hypothetical protein
MSRKRTYLGDTYEQGDYVRECDVCGLRYNRSELQIREYDGAIVCDNDYEDTPDTQKKRQLPLEQPYTID